MMRYFNSDKMRFLLAGGINTILSYAFYVFFLLFFHYAIAYTISCILSIVISYLLNTKFVFRSHYSWSRFFAFPLVYLVQYFVGLVLLHLVIEFLHVRPLLAPIVVVAITWPITYLLSRYILTHKKMV